MHQEDLRFELAQLAILLESSFESTTDEGYNEDEENDR